MKVKNIMFFGFAAAILSMGAASAATSGYTFAASTPANAGTTEGGYSAGRNIVASKSYVDLKGDQLKVDINTKQANIAGTSGQLVTSSGTAGTVNYTDVASSINTSSEADDANIPTVGAVENLVSTATADVSNKQNKDTNASAGDIAVFDANHQTVTGSKTFETTITDDDTKVPTSGAVVDYAQTKVPAGTAGQIFTYNGTTAGTFGTPLQTSASIDGTASSADDAKIPTVAAVEGYVSTATADMSNKQNKDTNASAGDIAVFDANHQTVTGSKTFETTITDDDTKVPTSGAVVDYVSTATADSVAFGDVIPAKPTFCTVENPCVLMQDNNTYNWYSMATDASQTLQVNTEYELNNPQVAETPGNGN